MNILQPASHHERETNLMKYEKEKRHSLIYVIFILFCVGFQISLVTVIFLRTKDILLPNIF